MIRMEAGMYHSLCFQGPGNRRKRMVIWKNCLRPEQLAITERDTGYAICDTGSGMRDPGSVLADWKRNVDGSFVSKDQPKRCSRIQALDMKTWWASQLAVS